MKACFKAFKDVSVKKLYFTDTIRSVSFPVHLQAFLFKVNVSQLNCLLLHFFVWTDHCYGEL